MSQTPTSTDGTKKPVTVHEAAGLFAGLRKKDTPAAQTPRPATAEATDETDTTGTAAQTATDTTEPDGTATQTDETQETEVTETEEQRKFKLFSEGEEIEVTLDEMKRGHLRQRDYTKKTQVLAEEKKTTAIERQAARQARDEFAAALEQASEFLARLQPKTPNFEELRRTLPPEQYAAAVADWQVHQDNLSRVNAERDRVRAEQFRDVEEQHAAYLTDQHTKLVSTVPGWSEPQKFSTGMAELADFAKTTYGWTDVDLAGVTDHRAILMLRDAMEHRRTQARRPEAQQKVRDLKAATPGASKGPRPPKSEREKAIERVRSTGRVADAAAFFVARKTKPSGSA